MLQIIVMKLMVYDKKVLKLTNVFSNDTGFKDIYEYVESKIRGKYEIVSRELVKSRIMPGVYGQKKNTFYKKIEKSLNSGDTMTLKEIRNMSKEITLKIDDQVSQLNMHLWEYLNLCEKVGLRYPEQCE